MTPISLQQQKESFQFHKCGVSLDLNKTFTLLAFPKRAGIFCLIWWVQVNECFEIPGFILCGLFLLFCCPVKCGLLTFAAMNSQMALYNIFYMNISALLGLINPSKHSMQDYFRPRRQNHRVYLKQIWECSDVQFSPDFTTG